jgi:hypothetical protein
MGRYHSSAVGRKGEVAACRVCGPGRPRQLSAGAEIIQTEVVFRCREELAVGREGKRVIRRRMNSGYELRFSLIAAFARKVIGCCRFSQGLTQDKPDH